jgi:hypothetical protein
MQFQVFIDDWLPFFHMTWSLWLGSAMRLLMKKMLHCSSCLRRSDLGSCNTPSHWTTASLLPSGFRSFAWPQFRAFLVHLLLLCAKKQLFSPWKLFFHEGCVLAKGQGQGDHTPNRRKDAFFNAKLVALQDTTSERPSQMEERKPILIGRCIARAKVSAPAANWKAGSHFLMRRCVARTNAFSSGAPWNMLCQFSAMRLAGGADLAWGGLRTCTAKHSV